MEIYNNLISSEQKINILTYSDYFKLLDYLIFQRPDIERLNLENKSLSFKLDGKLFNVTCELNCCI